jgi:hypothetical protein
VIAVRRLAAIVAADVAEYSRLIAADEATRRSPTSPEVQLPARIDYGDASPRRLSPFAVKKRIEAVQNATHTNLVRFAPAAV